MSDDGEEQFPHSYIEDVHSFLDRHINIVRYSSFVVAGIGILVLGRSIRVGSKFHSVKDIPPWMISKHIRLQGTVKQVDEQGILHIDHIPIITLRKKEHFHNNLCIKIAGTNINSEGHLWLVSNLTGKNIWFKMLGVDSKDYIQSIVKVKKGWQRYTNVNECIIKEGLGTVDLEFKSQINPKQKNDMDLLVKLLKLEESTNRKKMTRRDKLAEKMEIFSNFLSYLRNKVFKK